MAKAAKFKPVGSGVTIFVQSRPTPIEVRGAYETEDKGEIEALRGSPEVEEVKESKRGK